MTTHVDHCDTGAGRLEEGTWERDDLDPILDAAVAVDTPSWLDAAAIAAGPDRVLWADADGFVAVDRRIGMAVVAS